MTLEVSNYLYHLWILPHNLTLTMLPHKCTFMMLTFIGLLIGSFFFEMYSQ
jgi:hypothetical protein